MPCLFIFYAVWIGGILIILFFLCVLALLIVVLFRRVRYSRRSRTNAKEEVASEDKQSLGEDRLYVESEMQ